MEALLPIPERIPSKLPESSDHTLQGFDREGFAAGRAISAGVLGLLQKGLDLRDRYARQEISRHGLAVATGRIATAMDVLLWKTYRTQANRRLAKHLQHEEPWLFTFLRCPALTPPTTPATGNAPRRDRTQDLGRQPQ